MAMMCSNGFTKKIVTQPKVFSHSGIVFGYTTSLGSDSWLYIRSGKNEST